MRFSRFYLALKYANRSSRIKSAWFLFFVVLVFTFACFGPVTHDVRLALEGVPTQAVVKNKFLAATASPPMVAASLFAHGGGGRRGPSPQLRYEFTVGGQVFGGNALLSRDEWEAIRIGQPLEILYLPSDPRINRRAGPAIWLTRDGVPFWIDLVACISGLSLVIGGIRSVTRKVRLLADGKPALGVIEHLEIVAPKKGSKYISSLRYTYQVEEAGTQQFRTVEMSWPIPYLPGEVKANDVVLIAYDPSDLDRHEIDCFDARREDRLRLLAEEET